MTIIESSYCAQPGFLTSQQPGVERSTLSARAVWDRMLVVALTLNSAVGFRFVSMLRRLKLLQRDENVVRHIPLGISCTRKRNHMRKKGKAITSLNILIIILKH